MCRVPHVQGTACTGYRMYRVSHVQGTACTGYRLYRVPHVQGTECTGYRMYRVPHVQSTACTYFDNHIKKTSTVSLIKWRKILFSLFVSYIVSSLWINISAVTPAANVKYPRIDLNLVVYGKPSFFTTIYLFLDNYTETHFSSSSS